MNYLLKSRLEVLHIRAFRIQHCFHPLQKVSTILGFRNVRCDRSRGRSKTSIGFIKTSSPKETGFTTHSSFISLIPVASKVVLLFFLASTFSLSCFNSVKRSPRFMFVFPTCCYLSSFRQYLLARGSKITISRVSRKRVACGDMQTRPIL